MNMQQGIMRSHASPDLWISAEKKNQISRRIFCDVEFRRKKYVQQKSWGKALNQQKSTTQNQKMSSAEP